VSSIAARVARLEQRSGNREKPHTRWIGIYAAQAPTRGQQHAAAVVAQQPISIVWLFEDDHPAFHPRYLCWCGTVHELPF
jgi:hypothetical protein